MTLTQSLSIALGIFITLSSQAASVWKVSNDQHSLYIGGTIHILTPKDYPLAKEYDTAYQASEKIVFETDMAAASSPAFAQKMMSQMTYSDGTTIDQVLDASTYQALASHLASRNIPVEALTSYKPSLISITLTITELQIMGYTSPGVDHFYSEKAPKEGKQVGWLETPDEQLNFIKNMGKGDPNKMMEYTLKDIKKMPEMFKELHSTWFDGDMISMAKVGIQPFKDDFPSIYQDILVTRNNNWLPQIVAMLNDKPIEFVLVGALHLSGPDSVLAKLKAEGYKIEKL